MSRELLARAWAAGDGPGNAPFTIELDSTICETYGRAPVPVEVIADGVKVLQVGDFDETVAIGVISAVPGL